MHGVLVASQGGQFQAASLGDSVGNGYRIRSGHQTTACRGT
ncbi:Uncharacterised protein [Vibrio cholerae]|nr:Uncharacterised protein [Vibrio cholerae]